MIGWFHWVVGLCLGSSALIGGMIVYTNAIVNHERRCEALGGWVQSVPHGMGFCVKDGLVIRVPSQ